MVDELARLREEIERIDKELASLFERRMDVCGRIGKVKSLIGRDILDEQREKEVLERGKAYLKNAALLPYWEKEMKCLMELSKEYQWTLREDSPSPKK